MSYNANCGGYGYNGLSAADVAAVMGNNGNFGNGGCGNGFGWGGDGAWWLLVLFLFAWNGNGWGDRGNNGGNGGSIPYILNNSTDNEVQRGFDQQAVMTGLSGISSGVTSGFADVNQSLCSGFAGVNAAINQGFSSAEIANNARQMADMNQMFGLQTALTSQFNSMAMAQQQCCCDNRAATADLKYTIATEACNDRATVTNGIQNVLTSNDVNTRTVVDAIRSGNQSIMDKICQLELNAKDDRIAALTAENTGLRFSASQSAQTAQILAGQAQQALAVENNVNPRAVPAYIVGNPNGCGCNSYPYAYTGYNGFGGCCA